MRQGSESQSIKSCSMAYPTNVTIQPHTTFHPNSTLPDSTLHPNFTLHPNSTVQPRVVESIYTYPELVFCAVGLSILIVGTFFGNSLVLVAVARTRKLRNVTNVFVVNLSVSHVLLSFAVLWSVPAMVSETPGYPLQSDVPCVAAAVLMFIAWGTCVFTLANIALNRCILITRPKETYQWLYTPRKIALMVLGSWLVPLCTTVVPPLSGVGDLGFDPESRTCSHIVTHPEDVTYDNIQFALYYPLPAAVVLVSYVLIWKHVKKHFRKYQQHMCERLQSSTVVQTAPSSISMLGIDDSTSRRTRNQQASLRRTGSFRQLTSSKHDQLAITKNLFVVVLAFVVCFSPLAIMAVTKSQRYQLYGALILFLSGCINPLIYAAKHPLFAPVLRAMIRCRCSNDQHAQT
ncbi:G-protein coupled receptor moody-like [Patiria miniata]|uniref:G-protein coupled receptors family 1 profile domain-containing protein n=1 Tax=Patiria miniata TaxID=46514 RepID=A0A914ABY7_PATMI|nr:G-protein coupled receptor moody-like [Patiria miniata]